MAENEERLNEEDFGGTWFGSMRSFLWDLLEYPETSKAAQTIAALSMVFVCLSTLTFLVESNLENGNDIVSESETKSMNNTRSYEDEAKESLTYITQIIDKISMAFFTLEFLLRLFLCPNKKKFLCDKMNLVDVIAIIPFYLALLLEGLEDMEIIGKAGKIVRLIR